MREVNFEFLSFILWTELVARTVYLYETGVATGRYRFIKRLD